MDAENTNREGQESGGDALPNEPAMAGAASPGLPRKVRHELRSSIGQVLGYAELWLDEIEDEGGVSDVEGLRRDLARLQTAGRQILDIVNEFIDPVSQRARGLDVPTPAPVRGDAEELRPREPAPEAALPASTFKSGQS